MLLLNKTGLGQSFLHKKSMPDAIPYIAISFRVASHNGSEIPLLSESICADSEPFLIKSVIITGFGFPSKSVELYPINLTIEGWFSFDKMLTSRTRFLIESSCSSESMGFFDILAA